MRITAILFTLLLVMVFAVPVHASLSMSIDRDTLDFGVMESGATKTISDQGVYHNEVVCSSTNNKTWYLKAYLVMPFTAMMNKIPNESLQWMVVDVINGRGVVYNNTNVPNPFSNFKSLIYTSDPADNTGNEVKLRFRYILTLPSDQVAGNYVALVRWTITEIL